MKTILLFTLLISSISFSQTYNFPGGTIYTCGGEFYDTGGESGDYSDNTNGTTTFCSATPGKCIRVTLTMYDIESGYDYLRIYDGSSTSGTLLYDLDGYSTAPLTVTSTSGCLTFKFYADNVYSYGGWSGIVSCVSCATTPLTACTSSPQGTINVMGCSDVGTTNFDNGVSLYNTNTSTSISSNGPSPASSCGGSSAGANYGTWAVYDLDSDVTSIQISTKNVGLSGSIPSYTTSRMWTTVYQGNSCGSLTEKFCGLTLEYTDGFFSSGWTAFNDHVIDNLDPSKPVYIYTSYSHSNWICDNLEIFGFEEMAQNESCATAITSSSGCNLGAPSETSWTGPTDNGETCTGGTWYSNENTVYYTFTATDANATIDVENVVCNNGTSGEIQIGVWENCGDVGTYNSSFLGCAVGNGTLNLPSLTVGNTYVIVADGQAGDACRWDFVSTGIVLPVELAEFDGKAFDNYNLLEWTTNSERESDYFIIEGSSDGINFSELGRIESYGNSTTIKEYLFKDFEYNTGLNYYRLKQVDNNGEFEYHGPVTVYRDPSKEPRIVPNPVNSNASILYPFEANSNYTIVITNQLGQQILLKEVNHQFKTNEIQLDCNQLSDGYYLLKIERNGDLLKTLEFIKH